MAIIRDYFNSFKATDFVDGVTEVGNQYGLINSRTGLFDVKTTSQTAIVFDKEVATTTLIPQVRRAEGSSTQGRERVGDTFALPLAYFKHSDRLTTEDVQGWRKFGSTELEDIANATAQKMVDMRRQWDQTQEYMKLQALKGITKSPDGKVMANMFTEFSATQKSIDFLLGSASTNIDGKISELKRHIAANVKTGGAISGVKVLVDPTFFDKLISHANIKSAYNYYQNNGSQVNRDNTAEYMRWGVTDSFVHRGVEFLAYDATFNLPNGTQELAFAANTGLAYADGVQGLFRSYYGPSAKMSQANQAGSELFVRTYMDDRDEFVDFELESAPLHICTRPSSLVALTSSN